MADVDAAGERSAGEHDARRSRNAGAGLHLRPAHLRAGLQLDLDALGDQQVDVAEQRTGVKVSVALICAWRRSSLMLPNHVRKEFSASTVQGPERLTSPTPRTLGA